MIDLDFLQIDVQSFCDSYSYNHAMASDKKIERALEYNIAENSKDYNAIFLNEIDKCFKEMLANQKRACHGKGCSACDYYEQSITTINQFKAAF